MIQIIHNDPKALKKMLDRSQLNLGNVNTIVQNILSDVKTYGDSKVIAYTEKFDLVKLTDLKVSEQDIKEAFDRIDPILLEDLKKAKANIEAYHVNQMIKPYTLKPEEGITLSQLVKPIENVGIYVPGGTAAYPSTVLMNAVPAKIAGVKKIVMITPPNKAGKIKDSLLVAASIAGVNDIYKVGGAQGVAALAYGTQTIPKVDKIVGPGNIYVAMAKKMVSGYVGIDMIAGPSEILIIADEHANPDYIAADLMSQAEHDVLSAAICITTSKDLAKRVKLSLESQITLLERKDIIKQSLNNYGAIVITTTLDEAIDLANQIAPEHLELLVENPFELVDFIQNAGSVFLGAYTPEPVGDYFAGPNHTLPTSGTSRFSSGLSTADFLKKTSVSYYSEQALSRAKDSIIRLAQEEGLTAHANAVAIRFKE
ncbi:MAG: histidinol dehydrogenase [Acholeplasmataceae bacterium]